LEAVAAVDPLDAHRLGRGIIDDHTDALLRPAAATQDLRAGRTGGEDRDGLGQRGVELVARLRLDDPEAGLLRDTNPRRPAVTALHHIRREREHPNLGPFAT